MHHDHEQSTTVRLTIRVSLRFEFQILGIQTATYFTTMTPTKILKLELFIHKMSKFDF